MRFGRNPAVFAGDGWGGALDWDGTAAGMGTISMSNINVDQNRTNDGLGGGLLFSRGAGGSGVSLTNVNITSNIASRTVPANGTNGGGISGRFRNALFLLERQYQQQSNHRQQQQWRRNIYTCCIKCRQQRKLESHRRNRLGEYHAGQGRRYLRRARIDVYRADDHQ